MIAVGIVLPFLSPVAGFCFTLLYFASYKKPVFAALMVGLSLACFFFCMRTDASADVYRHMLLLEDYRSVGLLQCFGAGYYDNLYAWDLLNWVVARFRNPYLLQSACALLTYGLFSCIVFDYAVKSEWRSMVWASALLILLCAIPIISVVQGLRNALAFAIGSFALYRRHECEGSVLELFGLLFVAALIHHTALSLLLVVLVMIPAKSKPVATAVAVFFGTFLLGGVSQLLLPHLSGGNIVFSIAHDVLSVFSHYEQGTAWTEAHGSSFNTRVNNWALIGIVLLLNLRLLGRNGIVGRMGKGRPAEVAPTVEEKRMASLSLVSSSFAIAMILMLPANGDRFMIVACCFAVLAYGCCCQRTSHRKSAGAFVYDAAVGAFSAGCLALHAYSIYYNLTDAPLLITNAFAGPILTTWLF